MVNIESYPIDLVITWVDGSDSAWQKEKNYWLNKESECEYSNWSSGTIRYQDWDLLRYWFRGVERFIPWFHKIFFITWGHLPNWLNTEHEKLSVIRHEDYIPSEYLPTFNSRVIELNFHRIEELSEHFVYFNDDMFVVRPLKRESFFKDGLPRDFAGLEAAYLNKKATAARPMNAMILNQHFSKNEVIRKHPGLWLNLRYGLTANLKTALVMAWPFFSSIQRNHLPSNFLKSTFYEVWDAEYDKLDSDCHNRFREFTGVNQWLIQDWQRAEGKFKPIRQYRDYIIQCDDDISEKSVVSAQKQITNSSSPMVVINDLCNSKESFLAWSQAMSEAFQQMFPNKSTFEV